MIWFGLSLSAFRVADDLFWPCGMCGWYATKIVCELRFLVEWERCGAMSQRRAWNLLLLRSTLVRHMIEDCLVSMLIFGIESSWPRCRCDVVGITIFYCVDLMNRAMADLFGAMANLKVSEIHFV
jgi:hypothetical protein